MRSLTKALPVVALVTMSAFFGRKSIYDQITSKANRKGWLPAGFLLSGSEESPGAAQAPGEADGTLLLHSDMREINPEAFEEFILLLKAVCENPKMKKENEKALAGFFTKSHVLTLIDRLCDEVFNPERGIDLLGLADAALEMAVGSDDINIVKLGISLMGILNVEDRGDCRSAVIALGKYEEFTFYSLFAVSEWRDADRIASDYARNLKGWGKTHAGLWLEAD